eukprot:6478741-Amphidinium_carterae.1
MNVHWRQKCGRPNQSRLEIPEATLDTPSTICDAPPTSVAGQTLLTQASSVMLARLAVASSLAFRIKMADAHSAGMEGM